MRQVLLIVGLCVSVGVASAQTFGAITGEVRDPSGAVTPNASVTATNVATNVSRSTTSNEVNQAKGCFILDSSDGRLNSTAGDELDTRTVSIVPGPRIAPRPAYWKCRRVAAPFKLFLVLTPFLACRKLCKPVSKRVDELCKRVEKVSSESMSSHCGFPITPLRSTKRCDKFSGTFSRTG